VPVDTVGAGDASIAALAWSLLHAPARDGLAHLRFAVAAGAAACLAAGATPPSLEAIAALQAEMAS
jgi:fructokinase